MRGSRKEKRDEEREKIKKDFINALNSSYGIIYIACAAVKISRGTYYNWYNEDPEFRKEADEVLQCQAEFVEGKLLESIKNGDVQAQKFYLQTKGRHLGYSTRRVDSELPAYNGQSQTELENNELKRLNAEFTKQKKRITDLLKEEKKYTPELDLQIEICAKLKVQEETLNKKLMISGYSPTITEYSREGEPRSVVNPVWKVHQDVTDQLQKALRALGMNTESKDRKSDGDTVGGFLEAFQAKSEERAAALKRLEGGE